MTDEHSDHIVTREDVLVGRVTDGEATPNDWTELERIATKDPQVWERLALAQRAHARISRAVEDEIAIAELVDLPPDTRHVEAFTARIKQFGGWAAAAMIALAWIGARQVGNGPTVRNPGANNQAGLSFTTPDEYLQGYMERGRADGRVIAEMPQVLVESRPAPDGIGHEVWYVRQILERRSVQGMELLDLHRTEDGRPVYVRQHQPVRGVMPPL